MPSPKNTNDGSNDSIKFRANGEPYFVIPELEAPADGGNASFVKALNDNCNGNGKHDYNVSLPVNPLIFWDKFNIGILREYARLLPNEIAEIKILPYVEDYARTQCMQN